MPKVTISQEGMRAEVHIDGQRVSSVITGLQVNMDAKSLPAVTLQLVPLDAFMELEDAVLRFEGLGEPFERALLAHLSAKYEARDRAEILDYLRQPVRIEGVDMATGPDQAALAVVDREAGTVALGTMQTIPEGAALVLRANQPITADMAERMKDEARRVLGPDHPVLLVGPEIAVTAVSPSPSREPQQLPASADPMAAVRALCERNATGS